MPFDQLTNEENTRLVVPFTGEEIYLMVKESEGNIIPGLDKFNFAFFK